MSRLLREPIFHILLAGVAIFLVDAMLRGESRGAGEGEIHVPAGRVENLVALFAKTWKRPPTADELRSIVDDYVLEEALYREGLAMGLDRNDTVIRRRIRQKMEFVVADLVESKSPTETELREWFDERREDYRIAASYSFRQVFLDPGLRGDAVHKDAERLLKQLEGLANLELAREFGDRILLEFAFLDVETTALQSTFGDGFAAELSQLPLGRWSGPIASAFGLHLIYLSERAESRLPAFEEVRREIVRDFEYHQTDAAQLRLEEELLGRYEVTVEWPQGSGMQEAAQP